MPSIDRYAVGARVYDMISGEWLYGAGRVAGIRMLAPQAGDAVLDIGCGTGLNFEALSAAVGPEGAVIGLDRSPEMLAVARRRVHKHGWSNVQLLEADATTFTPETLHEVLEKIGRTSQVDAVLATYAMSVFPDWRAAWRRGKAVLRAGGRAAIVDMQLPTGTARVFAPLARIACALGGADIHARPWRAVETDCTDVHTESLRGAHITVAAGTLP